LVASLRRDAYTYGTRAVRGLIASLRRDAYTYGKKGDSGIGCNAQEGCVHL